MTPLKKIALLGAFAGGGLAAETAAAAERFRLVANVDYFTAAPSFGDTRQFTEFAETARVDNRYEISSGIGFDGALQVDVRRGLGLLVGYSSGSRDEKGTFDASLPHPLYLGRPRTLDGEFSGYRYKEGAVHADIAYGRRQGHFDWALFAGVSFFQVRVDLLDHVVYSQAYPYDTVTLGSTPKTTVKSNPTGFNVGGRLDYRFGATGHVGFGVQALFSGASVRAKAAQGTSDASFDAGGFQAGAGVRFYF